MLDERRTTTELLDSCVHHARIRHRHDAHCTYDVDAVPGCENETSVSGDAAGWELVDWEFEGGAVVGGSVGGGSVRGGGGNSCCC